MHLLLIDNLLFRDEPEGPEFDLQPHAGLMSLAAVARGGGHSADIYDAKWELVSGRLALGPSLYRDMATAILERAPDAVGFTALGCNFPFVVRVAGEVRRERPELPILLGGPQATI